MISRLGLAISRIFHKVCPDPFVIAILLTLLTAVLALALGEFPTDQTSLESRALYLLDAWRADSGFWKLLGFGMQMCLILVTGHALAATRPIRAAINAVADWPRTSAGGAAVVSLVACLTGLVNWGLGLIVGALLAREVGRSLTRRGIPVHYPLLAAAGYMGLLIFHGGLSGSAPLSATTLDAARRVLPESAVALLGSGVGLNRTLFSATNFFVTGGLVMIIPVLFWLLSPRNPGEMQPIDPSILVKEPILDESTHSPIDESEAVTIPDKLDRSRIIVWILAVPLLLSLVRYVCVSGVENIDLNQINAAMLALGLILHGAPKAYMSAVEDGARDCAGIIIQFPIYSGIIALMTVSGMVEKLATWFTRLGDQHTLPCMSFIAATLVGLFVPSGGAQWSVQGPIALRSAHEAGIDPGKMIMSIAYGDELANLLQPFWALPLLAITGIKARDIVGYTAIVMLVAGVWMAIGMLLF